MPGHGADDGIVAGKATERPLRTEARDLAVDQPRKALLEHVVADAPALHGAGLEVLDQHISAVEQLQQHRAPFRLAKIEPHRALVAVDADKVGSVVTNERRAPVANLVALWRLELDDIGAVIPEQLRGEWATQHARQVDDLDPGQRAAARLLCLPGHRYRSVPDVRIASLPQDRLCWQPSAVRHVATCALERAAVRMGCRPKFNSRRRETCADLPSSRQRWP